MGSFSPLSRHPWLFCFILCAASYFILSTSFPSLHRYFRHAKAGCEGHNDLCLMLLPRLLRGAEGETLPLTTHSLLPALPTAPLHWGTCQTPIHARPFAGKPNASSNVLGCAICSLAGEVMSMSFQTDLTCSFPSVSHLSGGESIW